MEKTENGLEFDDNNHFIDLPINNNIAKTIKAISKTTVHKICSGQVVLSLATAVKELVENSLDAGAKFVDIRLKDYGICSVEVSDNGTGICPEDFQQLGMKHCTSKLQDFEDLVEVNTFGFRGEAISSLCALSNLSVTTRHKTQTVGTKLVFDHNGKIKEQIAMSRQVGTTILLENLFHTLPVRHKEFLRNIKKEFNKMVQILYSYCLISTGVRIVCTNCDNGKKTTMVSTDGCPTVKDNLSVIFGHKQATTLLEMKQGDLCSSTLEEYGLEFSEVCDGTVRLDGYISSCAHGSGRSSTDRQFYFINSRPCDPIKISRLINDIYHQYNKYQYPLVVLNIKIKSDEVDINVTPDKRCIFISKEKYLLALIKSTLSKIYEKIPSTYVIHNPLSNSIKNRAFNSPINGAATDLKDRTPEHNVSFNEESTPTGSRLGSLSAKFSRQSPSSVTGSNSSCKRPHFSDGKKDGRLLMKQRKLENYFDVSEPIDKSDNQASMPTSLHGAENDTVNISCQIEMSHNNTSANGDCRDLSVLNENCNTPSSKGNLVNKCPIMSTPTNEIENIVAYNNSQMEISHNGTSVNDNCSELSVSNHNNHTPISISNLVNKFASKSSDKISRKTDIFLDKLKSQKKSYDQIELNCSNSNLENLLCQAKPDLVVGEDEIVNQSQTIEDDVVVEVLDSCDMSRNRKSLEMNFSLSSLKCKLAKKEKNAKSTKVCRKFIAKIDTNENQNAEKELKRELTKDNFMKMDVVGQFNLGFIIVRLDSDIFIVDQHATDEKYNFEQLEKSHTLLQQPMITPQELQLTPVNESILLDNLPVFKQNGFHFHINNSNSAGRRVCLTSVPHSRGWEFGVQDIEELIFMLSDVPGTMCRPSRVRNMLASRACRQSIMIGTALSSGQMKGLIQHMGEIDHPWNCPHGRPTMRHLINLDGLSELA